MPSASNQTLQHFNSQCCGSEELQGLFPILLFHRLAETFLQLGGEPPPVRTDSRARLSALNPTAMEQSLPQSAKTGQTAGMSMNFTKSCLQEVCSLLLRPFERDTHFFFSLVHPPLSIYQAKTSKRRIMPEFLSPKRRK